MPSRRAQREDVLEQLDAQRRADARPSARRAAGCAARPSARGRGRAACAGRRRACRRARPRDRRGRRARAARAPGARVRSRSRRAGSRLERDPPSRSPGWSRRREHDVLEHGHPRQRPRRLERADEPARAIRCGGGRSIRLPSSSTRPDCGRRKPEIAVEQRRLARAVRADQPGDRAAPRPSKLAPSTARTPPNARTTSSTSRIALTRAPSRRRLPSIPCGRRTTSPMITRPITIRRM